MQPTIDDNNKSNSGRESTSRRKRHSRSSRKKKKGFTSVLKWMKKNPFRVLALLCGLALIYITIKFFLYDDKGKKIPVHTEILKSFNTPQYL